MKNLTIAIVAAALLVGHAAAFGSVSADDKKPQKHSKRERAVLRSDDRSGVDVHVVFSNRDIVLIREYYAPRYRKLPKGLQKKLARTGQLPPGWQKKMEPFPVALERDLVVLPRGYRRGIMDGHAVIYRPGTQVIVDVAVLF